MPPPAPDGPDSPALNSEIVFKPLEERPTKKIKKEEEEGWFACLLACLF